MPKEESKRNKSAQIIVNPNTGERKIVFHEKGMNGVVYGSHTDWWRNVNKSPRLNSKRQQALREQVVKDAMAASKELVSA
jgi:hypothetical protein